MAHKKSGGSTDNTRDSNPKYLGFKRYGGEIVESGNIILRQRGTKFHAGDGTCIGRDHTIQATRAGKIIFVTRGPRRFGKQRRRCYIEVVAAA